MSSSSSSPRESTSTRSQPQKYWRFALVAARLAPTPRETPFALKSWRDWLAQPALASGPEREIRPVHQGAQAHQLLIERRVDDHGPVLAAGNPDTYRLAAATGANILTHLLGQTVEEVGERIRVYRDALEEYGFERDHGRVTMMLHTFVGDDLDEVREIVRQPMIDYLGSALGLVKNFAAQWTAFKKRSDGTTDVDINSLSDEEMADLLSYSFERYFETSGLFGTPERCLAMIDELKGIGVDEVACLIDFGVDTDVALDHLEHLNVVRKDSAASSSGAVEDHSLAAEIYRYGVTHLQCTPSTASMYLQDDDSREALATIQTLMIGGEAFPPSLVAELEAVGVAEVINMYGPTETTIWSSTYALETGEESISIGRPIANTQLYVLDAGLSPVPAGVAGELFIGGDGVVRGYLDRPELTAERFIDNPFGEGRIYRTGDLVRYREDGLLDFLGRIDHQVKVRGHRIELGEIEALVQAQPGVREVVVVAREDVPGDQRLVAYSLAEAGAALDEPTLRDALRLELPDFMVPSHFVTLDAFPLTPNAKIDRNALPAPGDFEAAAAPQPATGTSQTEERIIEIWKSVLRVPEVGSRDNFFDLGGHSLLAVKAHRILKEAFEKPLGITDLFRFPTVKALAEYLDEGSGSSSRVAGKDRAEMRRRSLARRRKLRARQA